MAKLDLFLVAGRQIELYRTRFAFPQGGADICSIRGKSCGAFPGYGTFQWSPAVRALTILVLRYTISHGIESGADFALSGPRGSLASSLDYAIEKAPVWLQDMFGIDSVGRPIARRLFLRTNPGQKRAAPVVVAMNRNVLPSESIRIFANETLVSDSSELLGLANALEGRIAAGVKAHTGEPCSFPYTAEILRSRG